MRRGPMIALLAGVALLLSGFAFASGLPGIPAAFQPYKKWTKVNAKPILPTPTTAHPGRFKNVYTSKRKIGGRYPNGTLLVKEGITGTGAKRFVSLIATMRKKRGADRKHGDWIFIEWARSSPKARFSEIARGAVCWGCHTLARKNDWVFTKR